MLIQNMGGAVAELSKALQLREKINENQKISGSPPGLGKQKKQKKNVLIQGNWRKA